MASSQPDSEFPDESSRTVKPFPWVSVLSSVWFDRKQIAIVVLSCSIVAYGVTFLLSPLYMAQTSVLPEFGKDKSFGLSGLSSLAEATGISVGDAPISKLYPMIVKSERLLGGVIYHLYDTREYKRPVNLIEYWEIDPKDSNMAYDAAIKKLRERLDVSYDMRLGTVSIAMEMEEPQLAADVANQLTQELDEYTRTKRKTNATLQREFIEKRMEEVGQDLRRNETALKEFRERNRRLADSPQLMLDQERLSREVQINSTVFVELKKQFEIAKIEEIKNIPLINVLDPARPPVRRSYPVRRNAVMLSFFLSLAGSILFTAFGKRGKAALDKLTTAISNNRGEAP